MFKNVISPIQAWLMSQARCVGCGKPLDKMESADWKNDTKKVTCECGRIFIFNNKTKKYRRALLDEV